MKEVSLGTRVSREKQYDLNVSIFMELFTVILGFRIEIDVCHAHLILIYGNDGGPMTTLRSRDNFNVWF